MKDENDIEAIDKLFRQSLEGYTPAPPASAWKNISSQLGRGSSSFGRLINGKMGLYFASTILLTITGILAYFVFFTKAPDSTLSNEPLNVTQIQSSDKNKPQTSTLVPDVKNNRQFSSNDSSNPTTSAINANEQIPFNDKPGNSSSAGKGNSTRINKLVPKQQSTGKQKIKLAKNEPVATAVHIELPATTPGSKNSNLLNPEQNAPTTDYYVIKNTELKELTNDSLTKSDDVKTKPPSNFKPAEGKTNGNPTGSTTAENNKTVPVTDSSPVGGPLPGDNPATDIGNGLSYYLGVSGGLGWEIHKELNTNTIYSGTAVAGITHKKTNISFETGIGYNFYNSQGSYEFDFSRSDTIGYTGYTLYNSVDSSYLFIFKPIVSDTLFSYDTITKTTYSYLEIPFHFSKQIFRSGKFSLGIKTGPSVEFEISHKETQPEYQLAGSDLVSVTNNSYSRLSTNWKWLIAPQFSWDITDKIIFRIEPAAILYLNNPYEPENRPSSKPFILSIRAGVVYSFRK